MVKGDNRRFAITAGGLILSAPASYVVQRALGSWGVLDDVSDSLGRWLKVHVPPATAGWTIALLFVLAIYGLLLWKVWRPRHIHHVDPAPEKIGFGDSAKAQIVRAPIQAGSADDPHRPLNRWLQESWEAAQADRRTKRKADRLREAEPRRDVALPEALAFATFGEWGKTFYDAVTAGLAHLIHGERSLGWRS